MKLIRVVLLASVLPALVVSCTPPVRRCGPTTCASGCCDANGECQGGASVAACGQRGDECRTCGTGLACSAGQCIADNPMGGGQAGGGGAGGGGAGGSAGGVSDGGTPVTSCAQGLTLCGERCVNLRNDFAHCGACAQSCVGAQFCENATCQNLPANCSQTPCPTSYFCDTRTNRCTFGCQGNNNCGGGQLCDLSRNLCACPPNTTLCGGNCIPVTTVTACGARCVDCTGVGGPNAVPSCTAGACDFTCQPGYHRCGNQCVSNFATATCGQRCDACPAPANAMATCDGTDCGLVCAAGFHRCGMDCVSDFDVATCGTSCSPCTAPANATAECRAPGAGLPPACDFTCSPGFARCGAACVAESVTACGPTCQTCTPPANATNPRCVAGACQYSCASGFHQCGSQCVSDTSVLTCGTSCTPCPAPVNGAATCNGTTCGIQCNPGFHECNGQCVSNLSVATCGSRCAPCPDGPMGSNTTATCDGVSCGLRCASTATPNFCGGTCVADSITTCGPSCQTCAAPPNGASASCVSGVCDFTCNPGFHRCGTQCVSDSSVDTCGLNCTPCPNGPANTMRTCTRASPTSPFVCGWDCAPGNNRCPVGGNTCVPNDYPLACGPTCAACSSPNVNERGVCTGAGICATACVTSCGGQCVNTQTSLSHCGACNTSCGSGDRCSEGECRPLCVSGISFASSLQTFTAFTSASFPFLLVDVNGDGRLDFVSTETSILYVRLGQPSGGISPTTFSSLSLSITPSFLVAGDLTGDGRPEIVAIGTSSTAAVLRNSGTGTFVQYTITANPLAFLTPSTVTIGEFTGAPPQDVLFGFNVATNTQAAILWPGVTGSIANPISTGASANIGIASISNLRAADVNNDGNSDVVATAAASAVFVFPGTGVGTAPFNTLGAQSTQLPGGAVFPTGAFPLLAGDVTGDGVPDVVVASVTGLSNEARVLPLTSSFTFGTSVSLGSPATVRSLSLGDVNGDGRRDVLVGSSDVRVFPSLTGGQFGAPQTIGLTLTSTNPLGAQLADVLGDSRPDVVLQSSSSIISVTNEGGSFGLAQGVSVPTAERLVSGDLNGDGLTDAVVTPAISASMVASVFFAVDGGTFVAGPTVPVRSDRVAIARLNGDTAFDLVSIGIGPDAGVVDAGLPAGLPNYRLADAFNPTPTTIRGRIEVFRNGQWGTVCDDGWASADSQVACRSLGYSTVGALFYGNNVGTLPILMDDVACLGTEAELLVCPFNSSHNCSNSEDVGLECSTVGAVPSAPTVVEVRFGATNGTLSAPVQLSTPTPATVVATGELDGDTNVDLIAATATTLHWFRNNGNGTFQAAQQVAALTGGASSLGVADLNNDGRRDLLVLNSSFLTVTPFINLGGGGFAQGTALTVSATTGSTLAVGDFNNDSKADFVVGTRMYRGDGSGGFIFQATLPSLPSRLVLSDLDNDGALDLAAAGSASSVLSLLRGDPLASSGFVTTTTSVSLGASVADVAPGSLNGDARRDLIILQGNSGARFLAGLPAVCR